MYYTIIAKQSDYTKEQFEEIIRAYTPVESDEKLNQYGVWEMYDECEFFTDILLDNYNPNEIWDHTVRELVENIGDRIGEDNNIYTKTTIYTDEMWSIDQPMTCGDLKKDTGSIDGFIENGQLFFNRHMRDSMDAPNIDIDMIKSCPFDDNEPVHVATFHW